MTDLIDLEELQLTRRTWVAAAPVEVYALISDVSAMSAWSPTLVCARYDDGHGPALGSWFTGLNRDGSHEWQTRMRVVEAQPGVSFAWTVVSGGADITTWRYTLRPERDGTSVEESWRVHTWLPLLGTTREELLALRSATAAGMEATLAALAGSIGPSISESR
jgi:hypothetical protein